MEIYKTKSGKNVHFFMPFSPLPPVSELHCSFFFFFFELVICLFDFSVIEKKKNQNIVSAETQAELPFLKERRHFHGTGPGDRAGK